MDEQDTIASVEAETPIEQELETEQPVDIDALETEVETEGDQQPEEDDDLEEFEWNGKLIKGPKGLKDNLLMHKDYTQKTQATASRERELDERAERITQQAHASEAEIQHRAALHGIDSELKRFEGYDWQQYQAARQSDPLGADEAWNYVQHLRGQRNEVAGKISEAETQRNSEAQQEFAKRMNDTQQYARSKGWTAETDKQVLDFALTKGASQKQLQALMDPLVYEMLYLARIGEEAVKKSTAPKAAPKPAIAPLTVVAAKASPSPRKSLSEMSMEEYVAARKAGRG